MKTVHPETHGRDHWLARHETIRRIWIVFLAILGFSVAADLLVHHQAHFGPEASFAFHAWFGFLACVGMVVLAKALGCFLKRADTYYDGEEQP